MGLRLRVRDAQAPRLEEEAALRAQKLRKREELKRKLAVTINQGLVEAVKRATLKAARLKESGPEVTVSA